MRKIFLFCFLLFCSSSLYSQIIITQHNYKDFVGKHLFFCKFDKTKPKYSINNKKFNHEKYEEKEVLIKNIDENLNISILDIDGTEIKIPSKNDKVIISNIGISEDLEKAKKFFIGKNLKKSDVYAKIYKDTDYSFPREDIIYNITNVSWEKTPYFFKEKHYNLILNTEEHIKTNSIDKIPEYFIEVKKLSTENNKKTESFISGKLEQASKTESDKEYYSEHLYKVSKNFDKLEKTITINLKNPLYIEKDEKKLYEISNIYFDIYQTSRNNIKKTLSVSLMYCASDWLFIEKCYIYIDGQKGELNIGISDRDVRSLIFETFHFPIGKNLLEKIIKAKEVVIRLVGSKGTVDAYFSAQNIYNIQRFYREYIK